MLVNDHAEDVSTPALDAAAADFLLSRDGGAPPMLDSKPSSVKPERKTDLRCLGVGISKNYM
jgi:hypothetical protein